MVSKLVIYREEFDEEHEPSEDHVRYPNSDANDGTGEHLAPEGEEKKR